MKYTGPTRRIRREAVNDLETKKKELYAEGYLIGNYGLLKHPFFDTYEAFIYYFEKR